MGTVGGKPTPEKAEELARDFDENCKRAAAVIKDAQFLLLCTGAGFSADSGLAVYKDIADVPAYHKMGLDYSALCVPDWIYDDPEIFYGFWGMCFNDYRKTYPHEGYHIIKRWKEKYFHPAASPAAERVHQKLEKAKNNRAERNKKRKETIKKKETKETKEKKVEEESKQEEKVEEERESYSAAKYDLPAAGPFFIYTSNVDAHSVKAGFSTNEVHEIHGNTETWQCSKPCTSSLWLPPSDFLFEIDKDTMRAPSTLPAYSAGDWKKHNGFIDNHPRCMNCGSYARPW